MEGSEKSYGATINGQKESFKFVTELCTFKEKFDSTKGFYDKIQNHIKSDKSVALRSKT